VWGCACAHSVDAALGGFHIQAGVAVGNNGYCDSARAQDEKGAV